MNFNYETGFKLTNEPVIRDWLVKASNQHDFFIVELNFVFCDDNYLLPINREYLNHDTLTDIITFDYSEGRNISGDIFISVERVRENALDFNVDFTVEIIRVMGHGLLHLMGFGDKEEEEVALMRKKENELIELFHVEH
ncbi:rRNA maturation RNase YbeY [Muricauda sp. DJ-13]|uniref:Endoribonuclease YbeY n=1 Tax=Croceivirga thetidis TaxID=2721623 RepID=A0ABX1GMS1_9FLAO|nr:rRNA maturation RNase YbeY [Croceivirga thetidis]